jgi:hypothetical protein
MDENVIQWLMEGDPAIQYQVKRDLLEENDQDIQAKIAVEGWGKAFLDTRHADGHWGGGYYQPKWISTHYTLLDIRHLEIQNTNNLVKTSVNQVFKQHKGPDGGINVHTELKNSDVCINGMMLFIACYFKQPEKDLESVVDFILSQQLADGGFNCMFNRSGARHSSLHSTISMVEGIYEYEKQGYNYRIREMKTKRKEAEEFILMHRLFRSDRTGKIIHPDFLKFRFPTRWKYDVLRCLDHFQRSGKAHDARMDEALEVLISKKTKDGYWKLNAHHPGLRHFDMEKAGKPSRWNTLRCLRVLKHYSIN